MDNIYIDRLLLVAFVKYILSQIYNRFQNCTFWYFLGIVQTFVYWGKYFQSLLVFTFLFYPEINNFSNSENVGRRKLPDPSMNNIFNVLSIGLQYTLSFKRPDFGLKCLVTITPKVQSLKFKANTWMKQA